MSFRAFISAYLLSMVVAILAGVYVFPITVPWPGLVMMWMLVLVGLAFYWRSYSLTKLGATLQGAKVEGNPIARAILKMQKFHFTILALLAVQTVVTLFATLIYFETGSFYTLFLTFEIVVFIFILLDWLNDELEIRRFLMTRQTGGGIPSSPR